MASYLFTSSSSCTGHNEFNATSFQRRVYRKIEFDYEIIVIGNIVEKINDLGNE